MRMLDIYSTVTLFGNIDLHTGKQKSQPMLYQTTYFKEHGNEIDLGRGVVFDKEQATVRLGNQVVPIKRFVLGAYDKEGWKTQIHQLHPDGKLSLVYLKDYSRFLIMGEYLYNSTYVQLFILEQYDPELFEPVVTSPWAKVYRLKK
jgi:dolichyl-diphosphooligosaccharide--protein glycosyltransferase/undecaprenyl-diphosphooligosaccharide--protein glycosyltransferase